jgi:DNA-3-methyladenine glycosylase II
MSTRAEVAKAARSLAKADPVMAGLIKAVGLVELPARREPFPSIVRSIMYQQLAGPAAAAIMRRFQALYPGKPFPSPQDILATSDDALRSAGVSRQKVSYLRDLSAKFADGVLNEDALFSMPDSELEQALMSVRGVGRWTADMFLMFTLGRMDILALDDLGLRRGAQKAYRMGEAPTPKELAKLGERWRPYRSVASIYLWRSLGVRPPEPPKENGNPAQKPVSPGSKTAVAPSAQGRNRQPTAPERSQSKSRPRPAAIGKATKTQLQSRIVGRKPVRPKARAAVHPLLAPERRRRGLKTAWAR